MRWILGLAGGLAMVLAAGSVSFADVQRNGLVTYVSDDAVDLNGERILLGPDSLITSGGRAVSVHSLRRGMPAEAEIDDAGKLIVLEAKGVVE